MRLAYQLYVLVGAGLPPKLAGMASALAGLPNDRMRGSVAANPIGFLEGSRALGLGVVLERQWVCGGSLSSRLRELSGTY